jgi:hypothetical protein
MFPEGVRFRPLLRGCRLDYVPPHLIVTYNNVTIIVSYTSQFCNSLLSLLLCFCSPFDLYNLFFLKKSSFEYRLLDVWFAVSCNFAGVMSRCRRYVLPVFSLKAMYAGLLVSTYNIAGFYISGDRNVNN